MAPGPVTGVVITVSAAELLARLQERHGPVMFHQSGGCCDGSAPMCYPLGDFIVGDRDVLLGVLDVGSEGVPVWTGRVGDFLRLGGDLRTNWTRTELTGAKPQQTFQIDQVRAYAAMDIVPERFSVYVDEQIAPGNATAMEAWARLTDASSGTYLKAGRLYLPFGWRLQDQTAFVRETSGISMATPDTGLELGFEREHWSAQLAVSHGTANAGQESGHQVTSQVVWVQSRYRLGGAVSLTQSDAGNRRAGALFAGVRTGPVAWLGEIDLVRDGGVPEGSRSMIAMLGEANYRIRKGHNLKLTAEYLDPDRRVAEDQQTRWSALYEYTPMPFLQLRAGLRRYRGIPQSVLENRRVAFIELHGFW